MKASQRCVSGAFSPGRYEDERAISSTRHLLAGPKAPSICLMQDRRGREPGHWRSPPWPVRTRRDS